LLTRKWLALNSADAKSIKILDLAGQFSAEFEESWKMLRSKDACVNRFPAEYWLFMIVGAAIILLTFSLYGRITDIANSADARQNLHSAYNLAFNGVISHSTSDEPQAGNYREPLPIISLAIHILAHPALSSELSIDEINEGKAVIAAKSHILFWVLLLYFGIMLVSYVSIPNKFLAAAVAAVSVYMTNLFFVDNPGIIDRLMTELHAAALLVWSSAFIILALRTGRFLWFCIAGISLALLSLTKALFLYVAIGFIVYLIIFYCITGYFQTRIRSFALVGAMVLSTAIVLSPWMIRNYIHFQSFEITQRGGVVMLVRAFKNDMTDVEWRGAFYVYGPSPIRNWLEDNMGYSRDDLEIDGPLKRLNRSRSSFAAADLQAERMGRAEDAITFYRAARAERVRLREYYQELGVDNAAHRADEALQQQALALISQNPIQHLKTTIAFMWRGMWSFRSQSVSSDAVTTLNALGFCALWTLFLIGIFRFNPTMIAITILPVGALAFLGLTSHFIPRYSAMTIPNMLLAFIIASVWIFEWFFIRAQNIWQQHAASFRGYIWRKG